MLQATHQIQAYTVLVLQDSEVMKTVALLTMILLPATFLAVSTPASILPWVNPCICRLSSAPLSSRSVRLVGEFRLQYGYT